MPAPIVRVHNLTKRFGDFTAVDHISFEIQPGETVGLLGPNGAGKTTTFQMLLDVITPTHGTIEMFGLNLVDHRETILRQVNFSSTYISMPYALTVEENLRVVGWLYGLTDVNKRIDEMVDKLGMEAIRHTLTRKLSSGQATMLTLAKAVMIKPKILLLDEPTASLDPDIAHKIKGFLKDYRETSGLSMLYTSHNMREMEEMSDRIMFLRRGKIITQGTTSEVLDQYGERDLERVFVKISRDHV